MAKIKIDVAPEATLLQACEAAGAEVPRFCFHKRLSIAGNWYMYLIRHFWHEIEARIDASQAVARPLVAAE
jgi:hypothetical protein